MKEMKQAKLVLLKIIQREEFPKGIDDLLYWIRRVLRVKGWKPLCSEAKTVKISVCPIFYPEITTSLYIGVN